MKRRGRERRSTADRESIGGSGTRRAERVASEIHRALATLLLHRIRDPRVTPITLTRVLISPDLRQARIYFTLLDDDADGSARAAAEQGLAHAAPFFRHHLAEDLKLRFTPELEFHFDTQLEGARRVEALLRGLRKPEGSAP